MLTGAALRSLDQACLSPSLPHPDIRPELKFSPGEGRQAGTTALSRHSREEEEEFLTLMMAISFTARLMFSRVDSRSRDWTPRKAGCKSTLGERSQLSLTF